MLENNSTESWRKPMSQQSNKDKPLYGDQQPFIDTLKQTREKNWFFDTVDKQDESYFPYGAPGNGAPLRNPDTNEIVSKLPHIEERLWKNSRNQQQPSPTKFLAQSNTDLVLNNKKQEIHNFIDEITRPKQQDFSINEQQQNFYSRPKKVKTGDPNQYWTDWFGKPGNGAPNWDYRKQKLDYMLEPRNSRDGFRPVYDPISSLSEFI
jgi:hypothetical protein